MAPASFPKSVRLRDGSECTLRFMAEDDQERLWRFFRSVPAHDRLFLRYDVTDPSVIEEWLRNLYEYAPPLLAEQNGEIIGNAALHRQPVEWAKHVGEVWMLVGPQHRFKGLGTILTHEIMDIAVSAGCEKVIAETTSDQTAAIITLAKLGFRFEGYLIGQVKEMDGTRRDLIVMAYHVPR